MPKKILVTIECESYKKAEQVRFNLLFNKNFELFYPEKVDRISLSDKIKIVTLKHMNFFERTFRLVTLKWKKWEFK